MMKGEADPGARSSALFGARAAWTLSSAVLAAVVTVLLWPKPAAGASCGCLGDAGKGAGAACFRAVDIVVAQYGDGPGELGLARTDDGALFGISTFCVGEDGAVLLADPVRKRILAYRGKREPIVTFAYPSGASVIKLEATAKRVFALCSRGRGEDFADRSTRRTRGGSGASAGEGPYLMSRQWGDWRWSSGPEVGSLLKPPLEAREDQNALWRLWLVRSAGEVYLYDPRSGLSHRLTQDGQPLSSGCAGVETVEGWMLPCGARAVKADRGISLLWCNGSRRDMPWLAGSLIGGDAEGRLYVCEIENELDKPEVCVAVYSGLARPCAKWRLPGRPGAVRMRGPRIIVSDDGGVYEFWSSLSELHIVKWEAPVEAADTSSSQNR